MPMERPPHSIPTGWLFYVLLMCIYLTLVNLPAGTISATVRFPVAENETTVLIIYSDLH